MADNVNITQGAGTAIAADDVSGIMYQRVKVCHGADGSANDTSSANPLPVAAASLPLPAGAAKESGGNLETIAGAVQDQAVKVNAKPTKKWKWSFAKVVASGVDTAFASVIQTGSGMSVSQSAGNLLVTTGTTAYAETIIRSNDSQAGSGIFRYLMQLSQRIVNQNFVVEWVDLVGDGLSMTINSATSVTVQKTAHGFTDGDIGKGIWIGALSVASCLTQRAVIASIPSADSITFTVVGFPASGSGTCSLFGYNHYQVIYSGATATSLGTGFTTQRLGWANTPTNATINTTAAPGHIGIIETSRNNDVSYLDHFPGTATGAQATVRGCFNQNCPDVDTPMYLQIRVFNGSTAPASTTTMTLGFVDAETYSPLMVNLAGVQPIGYKNLVPMSLERATATITATLAASTNRAAFMATPGIWYDDSSTALAAGASFTGTSRDLTVVATATAFNSASTYADELRVSAESDQAGTLWLEVSRDNTNWRRVKSVPTAAVTGGGQYAEIIHSPSWRYARVGFTNGATLQTRFAIGSMLLA